MTDAARALESRGIRSENNPVFALRIPDIELDHQERDGFRKRGPLGIAKRDQVGSSGTGAAPIASLV